MFFKDPSIFIDAIILLVHVNDDRSHKLVSGLLNLYNERKKVYADDEGLIGLYIVIIKEIMKSGYTLKTHPNELITLLIKFKSSPVASKNEEAYKQLSKLFLSETEIHADTLTQIKDRLQNCLLWETCNRQLRRMFMFLNKSTDIDDPTEQGTYLSSILDVANDLQESVKDIGSSNTCDKLALEKIDFTDRNSLKSALNVFTDRKKTNVLRTGFQGLNMMLGERGGFGLGESVSFNSYTHNGKSMILKLLTKWITLYNRPPKPEEGQPDGKPLILFISLENEASDNMYWWFRNMYETTFQESAAGKSDEEVIEFLMSHFNERGYTVICERYHPNEFGYEKFKERIEYYIASGYRVITALIDYLSKMKKSNNSNATNHFLIAELFSNICNYCKGMGILMATGHQLNRDAIKLLREGQTNLVKRFNGSFLADSVDVQREIDISIYMHIEENHLGTPYWTFNLDKHRGVENTPVAHKYFAYKFNEFGIADDVDKEAAFTRDIYAETKDPDVFDAPIQTTGGLFG